jgi:hypothetical protein
MRFSLIKISLLALFCITTVTFGQFHSGAIKFGVQDPQATDAGFNLGYQWERSIDKNFDIGWEVDWFHKTYTDENLVSELNDFNGDVYGTTNELLAKTTLYDFPAQFTMEANFPIPDSKLRVFGNIGLGLDFLFISYKDYSNPDDGNTKAAVDFSWRVGAGIIYPIGTNSELIGELNYHSSEPSWQYQVHDSNTGRTHTFERSYNMGGILARVGVRFYY